MAKRNQLTHLPSKGLNIYISYCTMA